MASRICVLIFGLIAVVGFIACFTTAIQLVEFLSSQSIIGSTLSLGVELSENTCNDTGNSFILGRRCFVVAQLVKKDISAKIRFGQKNNMDVSAKHIDVSAKKIWTFRPKIWTFRPKKMDVSAKIH